MVQQCPRGKVVSYGGVAALLGYPRAARGVGHALSALTDLDNVPWWRVVNRNGQISISSGHGAILQRKLLEQEGVIFDQRGRIDWAVFGWDGRRKSRVPRAAGRAAQPDSGSSRSARSAKRAAGPSGKGALARSGKRT
jgi:methylated-DNA-protein-cysteine methyltransferase-like protein